MNALHRMDRDWKEVIQVSTLKNDIKAQYLYDITYTLFEISYLILGLRHFLAEFHLSFLLLEAAAIWKFGERTATWALDDISRSEIPDVETGSSISGSADASIGDKIGDGANDCNKQNVNKNKKIA